MRVRQGASSFFLSPRPEGEKKSIRRLSDRLLPEGTFSVGIGLIAAGLANYGFLVVSARAIGPRGYGALAALWALTFLIVPGFFAPIEQEVGRALAARRAVGNGVGLVIRRAALTTSCLAAALLLCIAIASDALLSDLFDEQFLLLVGFALALVGFSSSHLVKGILSGTASFGRYGLLLSSEGLLRVLACAGLAFAGAGTPGPYGLALGLTSLVALIFGINVRPLLADPGPEVAWGELTRAFGHLFIASLFAAFLLNAAPLAVKLLATSSEQTAAGRFLGGLVIARVPLFLFQAVQVPLLPRLSVLAASGLHAEFRADVRRVLALISVIGCLAMGGALTIGDSVLRLLLGRDFALGHGDIAYLVGASISYMVTLTFSYALVARARHGAAALSWAAGCLVFLLMLVPHAPLLLRVERALLAGSIAAGVMAALALATLPAISTKLSPAALSPATLGDQP